MRDLLDAYATYMNVVAPSDKELALQTLLGAVVKVLIDNIQFDDGK